MVCTPPFPELLTNLRLTPHFRSVKAYPSKLKTNIGYLPSPKANTVTRPILNQLLQCCSCVYMSKPVIVCIPGPCQSPEIYVPLRSALYLDGYTLIPLSLPSIGNVPPPYDFAEDVIAVRQLIIELIEKEKDVILVMQGFSGITGSQAIHGLSKLERERQGTKGGVVRLVFIMGWTVPEGFQGAQREDVSNLFSYMKVDPAVGTISLRMPLLTMCRMESVSLTRQSPRKYCTTISHQQKQSIGFQSYKRKVWGYSGARLPTLLGGIYQVHLFYVVKTNVLTRSMLD